ncbi:MAG: hypothetical protein O2894_11790 [Planctomycetota bacterium]|nr:hypothetical protein [Planctomycetota bacterium]
MEQNDWTPAVLLTATICLATAGLVWIVAPFGPTRGRPGAPTIPLHDYRQDVVVWTGDLAPGLKGVLGPVWGDAGPDRDHDGMLNGDLGLRGPRALAYFRLLVFNTSEETQTLELRDGDIRMTGPDESRSQTLRSLGRMLEAGEIHADAGLRFTLGSIGALVERVDVLPGTFAKLVVPFDGEARIEQAHAVVTAQGLVLRRVEMAKTVFRSLMERPDEARVRDL